MNVLNENSDQISEQLSVQPNSLVTNWFMRLLSIISYIYFFIFNSPEETSMRSIKDIGDPRLDFLISKDLLKGDIKVEDVRRALCLDLNLGEKYEKHIIFLFKAFFNNNEHRKLYSVILEKFILGLISGTYDPEAEKKYEVEVDFDFKRDQIFNVDSIKRISNIAKFIALRVLPVETTAIISFDDFELSLKKVKMPSSTNEANPKKALQYFKKLESDFRSYLNDSSELECSSESECSTEKDAPYKYIFPKGTKGQLFYNLKWTTNYFQNAKQEKDERNNWMDFCSTVSTLIEVLKAHLKMAYENLYEIGGKDNEDYYCESCAINVLREDFIRNYFDIEDRFYKILKGSDITQLFTLAMLEWPKE